MPCKTTIERIMNRFCAAAGKPALARRAGVSPRQITRYCTYGNGVFAPVDHHLAFECETGDFELTKTHLEENGFLVIPTKAAPRRPSSGDDMRDAIAINCAAVEYVRITYENYSDGVETEFERQERRAVLQRVVIEAQTKLREMDDASDAHHYPRTASAP